MILWWLISMGNACCAPNPPPKLDEEEEWAIKRIEDCNQKVLEPEGLQTITEESPDQLLSPTGTGPDLRAHGVTPKEETAEDAIVKPLEDTPASVPTPTREPTYQERFWEDLCKRNQPKPDFPGVIQRRPSSENIGHDAYTNKYKHEFDQLVDLAAGDGWKKNKEVEGVSIYTRPPMGSDDHPFHYFMGQSRMTTKEGLAGLLHIIEDTERRPEYDETCQSNEVLQAFAPFYKIARVRIYAPAIVLSNRELTILGRMRFLEDGSVVILMKSVRVPEFEDPKSKYVTAKMLIGGYVIRPVPNDPENFDVSWLGCVDPGGWIPTWVSNLVSWKQAMTLSKMKKLLVEPPKHLC